MNITSECRLKVGLLINPYAGIGGPAGFKGSDGLDPSIREKNKKLYGRASERALTFLCALHSAISTSGRFLNKSAHVNSSDVVLCYCSGDMGATTVDKFLSVHDAENQFTCIELNVKTDIPSTAVDTKKITRALLHADIDILVFVGGEGKAGDIYDVVSSANDVHTGSVQQLVLGIPSGVKMHSGVFALDPQAAADAVYHILCGDLVGTHLSEVRDIDECLLRGGKVNSKYYGEMRIPTQHEYIQAVKQGGQEVEELVLLDISHEIRERMSEGDNILYIFSPGTTCHFILQELGFDSTLLGFDLLLNNKIIANDANADDLQKVLSTHAGKVRLVLTPIGGQGYLIGRGNQQLTPRILGMIGRENLWIVATKTKLKSFPQRILYMDSNDSNLDKEWAGLVTVITGYHDEILYRLGR